MVEDIPISPNSNIFLNQQARDHHNSANLKMNVELGFFYGDHP